MAIIDVKRYYYEVLNQYLEMKEDIADFEEALKDGYITEDKLEEVKNDIFIVKENLDRLSYVMHLLNLPKRKAKQDKYRSKNSKLENYFEENKATSKNVIDENTNVLKHFKDAIVEIKK